mmetsp:Transcript_10387/g.25403  ORF Transcript_10387/g.25403 Transcript_10387/m.25403 type:complete len:460 (-) Transcript_10387:266-1645(-)
MPAAAEEEDGESSYRRCCGCGSLRRVARLLDQKSESAKLFAVAILAIIVIGHYKLMQTIQREYRCKYTLLLFTAAFGTIPLLFVSTLAKRERERRKAEAQAHALGTIVETGEESDEKDLLSSFSQHQHPGPKSDASASANASSSETDGIIIIGGDSDNGQSPSLNDPYEGNHRPLQPTTLEGGGSPRDNRSAKDGPGGERGRDSNNSNSSRPFLGIATPAPKLLKQAVFIGVMNTLAFFTSIVAITHTPLWISMALFKVDCAFNLALSALILGERCSISKVAGSLITLAGAVVLSISSLIARGHGGNKDNSLFGDVVSIVYALELSFLMIGWKVFLKDFCWSLLFALNGLGSCAQLCLVLPVLAWSYTIGEEGNWEDPATVVMLCCANGIISLMLALWWSFCIGYTSPTYVAVAGVVVVPMTTLLDYLTLGIRLHWLDGVATVVIIAGFLLTKRGYQAE